MTLPDFLRRGPLGEVRFAGSRIDLYFVVAAFNQGHSPGQIAAQYPTLPPDLIRSAIAYYLANREAVDEYVRGVNEEIAHNLAAIPRVDGAPLRQRFAERHPERAGGAPPARE
jgi:uncharacterized protein (DUF433 family)